ncbi:MAG: hypothetical protein Q7S86_05615 [bacterium]|nr:hypothetical protein [bacterium]
MNKPISIPHNVILVGVRHDLVGVDKKTRDRLISYDDTAAFKEVFIRNARQKTLLCPEGGSLNGVVSPIHVRYSTALSNVCEGMETWGISPDLLFCDPRLDGKNSHEQRIHKEESFFYYDDIVPRTTRCYLLSAPKSLEDVLCVVRDKNFEVARKSNVNQEDRRIARNIRRDVELFDREHLRRLRMCAAEYDVCIVVCGALHAISLHLKTDWPLHLCLPVKCYAEAIGEYVLVTAAADLIGQ